MSVYKQMAAFLILELCSGEFNQTWEILRKKPQNNRKDTIKVTHVKEPLWLVLHCVSVSGSVRQTECQATFGGIFWGFDGHQLYLVYFACLSERQPFYYFLPHKELPLFKWT